MEEQFNQPDYELFILINKMYLNYAYYLTYGNIGLYELEVENILIEFVKRMEELDQESLNQSIAYIQSDLESINDVTLKQEMIPFIEEIDLLQMRQLKKIHKVEKRENKNEKITKIASEMIKFGEEKSITIESDDALLLSEFLIAQMSVEEYFENSYFEKEKLKNTISKTEMMKKFELEGLPIISEKKEKTLYEIMNRIIPTKMKSDSTDHKAELSLFQEQLLKYLLLNYDTEYVNYLYALSNSKRKKIPKCISISEFMKAKENTKKLYDDFPLGVTPVTEKDKCLQKLLEQEFSEDTHHFSLIINYTNILTEFSDKLLQTLYYADNVNNTSFNNNIFISIFMNDFMKSVDNILERYFKFILIINDVYTTRNGILKDAVNDEETVIESANSLTKFMNDVFKNIETNQDNHITRLEKYSDNFKKVMESIYDVKNPNNPFEK